MNKLIALLFAFAIVSTAFAQDESANGKHTVSLDRRFVKTTYTVDSKKSNVDGISNRKKDGVIELYSSENGKSSQKADSTQECRIEEKSSFNIQLGPTPQGGFGLAFNF